MKRKLLVPHAFRSVSRAFLKVLYFDRLSNRTGGWVFRQAQQPK